MVRQTINNQLGQASNNLFCKRVHSGLQTGRGSLHEVGRHFRIKAHAIRSNRQRQQQVPAQVGFRLILAVQNPPHKFRDLGATLFNHPQLSGAQKNRFTPARIVQVRTQQFPSLVVVQAGDGSSCEVLLERQMQEAKCVLSPFHDQSGHVTHIVQ